MQRRLHETDSNVVREELAKFMSHQSCPDCGGSRLNRAARHTYINDQTLPEVTSLSIDSALALFSQLHLDGWRGEVAEKIVKEICERL